MKNIRKPTNVINHRLLTSLSVLLFGTLLTSTVAFAQVTDTVDVTASVNAGVSTLNITETAVGFGALTPAPAGSRFESANVTGDYFAANGPWELRVYTTDANDAQGLVGSGAAAGNTIALFKVDPGADNDVTNDDDWANTPEFHFVLDDGSLPFATVASSLNGYPANNPNLVFNFGVDVAGAAPGPYAATVTVDLAIL